MLSAQTLLLDQSYAPLRTIPWQRAIALWVKGRVEIVTSYDGFVHSAELVIKIPAVVRLLRVFKRFRKPVKFSRANIYSRDRQRCQYCGEKFEIEDLTYDHILPRRLGGKTEWENIVTCCYGCNRTKGGRTPEQAGMKLLRTPERPTWVPLFRIRLGTQDVPEAWRSFLYWDAPLDE